MPARPVALFAMNATGRKTRFVINFSTRYPAFADRMAAQGTPLPDYVQREFEGYLKCGRLEAAKRASLFCVRICEAR